MAVTGSHPVILNRGLEFLDHIITGLHININCIGYPDLLLSSPSYFGNISRVPVEGRELANLSPRGNVLGFPRISVRIPTYIH